MVKKMVHYLKNNPQIARLVTNGEASLVGISPSQQKAVIEILHGCGPEPAERKGTLWI